MAERYTIIAKGPNALIPDLNPGDVIALGEWSPYMQESPPFRVIEVAATVHDTGRPDDRVVQTIIVERADA